jgi:hypothetical protein
MAKAVLYSSCSRTASSHGFSTIWTSSSEPVDMVAEVVLIEPASNAIVDGTRGRREMISIAKETRDERVAILGLYYFLVLISQYTY